MLADVRVRSGGQGNVSGFSIFIAIIPSRLLCQIGTLSRFRKRKKFRRCLFTSSINMMLGNFHVVVVVLFIQPIAVFFTLSLLLPSSDRKVPKEREQHWKLKRSVSAPKCQFSPAGQSLIQPFLKPFEHNLGQKKLNQKAIPAHGRAHFSPGTKSALANWTVLALISGRHIRLWYLTYL